MHTPQACVMITRVKETVVRGKNVGFGEEEEDGEVEEKEKEVGLQPKGKVGDSRCITLNFK